MEKYTHKAKEATGLMTNKGFSKDKKMAALQLLTALFGVVQQYKKVDLRLQKEIEISMLLAKDSCI